MSSNKIINTIFLFNFVFINMVSLKFLIVIVAVFLFANGLDHEERSREKLGVVSYAKSALVSLLNFFKRKTAGRINSWLIKDNDIKMNTEDLIVSRGFISETHSVETEDGYILGIYRIRNPYISPRSKRKSILIWHQLFTNSNLWLISSPGLLDKKGRYREFDGKLLNNCENRPGSNLVFTLAACGYDVWLGNSRGTRYSTGHRKYSRFSPEFNNYTFTELAIYDTKNTIEYIMNYTKSRSMAFIGSSQGTTQMIILLSLYPSIEKCLKPIILIPPVAYVGNITSVLRLATPLVPILNDLIFAFGFPLNFMEVAGQLCSNIFIGKICSRVVQLFFGIVPSPLTDTRTYAKLIVGVGDNLLSWKMLLQYAQFVLNGRFCRFDYLSPNGNMRAYGQRKPPDYPLANITSKNLVLIRGPNDSLAPKGDVEHLIASLTVTPRDVYVVHNPSYHHLDFPLSKFNTKLLNWRILAHLAAK